MMMLPTMVLAYFRVAIVVGDSKFGVNELAFLGAAAGAIPVWFSATYTNDTAIAAITLPLFRRNPLCFFVFIGGAFTIFEIAGFTGIPFIRGINWFIGWLIFQILGFAW